MDLTFELSSGKILEDDGTLTFWRERILSPYQKEGITIRKVLVNGEPFQPNAHAYFMLFQSIAFVNSGATNIQKGIGYVKTDTNRARIIWKCDDGEQYVEVKKPIPEFIHEIAVPRENA